MRENQFSTWFSHDEYVGVKCMRTLPCCTRKSRTRWVLWLLTLSQMTWISCRSHWLATMSVRKATNCSLVWRGAVLPSTWPVAVFSAANKLGVPFLLDSNPWLSARPGDSGSVRTLRSSAWIAVFSSTQNTTACPGGLRYSPITSAALVSKSGSLDTMCRSSLCARRSRRPNRCSCQRACRRDRTEPPPSCHRQQPALRRLRNFAQLHLQARGLFRAAAQRVEAVPAHVHQRMQAGAQRLCAAAKQLGCSFDSLHACIAF